MTKIKAKTNWGEIVNIIEVVSTRYADTRVVAILDNGSLVTLELEQLTVIDPLYLPIH